MALWKNLPNKKPWRIGITNPFKNKIAQIITASNTAITTSGDYEKFTEINNIRYAHIINPKTAMPATGLTSVTVIGPSAEMANGFSTSIMVLGKKEGMKLLKNYPEYSCILITDKGKIIRSKNYKKRTDF